MSALPTRIEKEAGQRLTPLQIFDITAARETTLSRLLMLYISTGLLFMLLPGTFLGVWNLLAISSHRAADSVSRAWIQAHGHAQIFGWTLPTWVWRTPRQVLDRINDVGKMPTLDGQRNRYLVGVGKEAGLTRRLMARHLFDGSWTYVLPV
jgi:hypothetical protein